MIFERLVFKRLIFEDPQPQIKQDWDNGHYQWREITCRTYRTLAAMPSFHREADGFMSAAPVDTLRNGEGLHMCCKQKNGYYFARLIPRYDWGELKYYPLPKVAVQIN